MSSWQQHQWRNPPGARYRESTASRWRQNLLAKVGPAACRWKADEEVRLVERKFALFWRLAAKGKGLISKGRLLPNPNQWARTFIGRGSTLYVWTAQSALTVALKLVVGSLTSVISVVFIQLVFCSRVGLFPFPWGQFLGLWQLTSWLQSGHHVVINNFFHLVGFQYL